MNKPKKMLLFLTSQTLNGGRGKLSTLSLTSGVNPFSLLKKKNKMDFIFQILANYLNQFM